MKLPHPIQYQGSKRNLATQILNYIPNNIDTLIEPFAGTAALSVAAATQKNIKKFHINDLNEPLLNLLKLIIEKPEQIADFYETLWQQQHNDSVEHYYSVRKEFNQTQDSRLFLYLLARCAKGAVRYNNQGEMNQSPDKRRKGTQPATMRKNIFGVSALLKGKCYYSSNDYKQVLKNIGKNDLVYFDPPYQGVCGNKDSRYFASINHAEFIAELEKLNQQQVLYLISYDGKTGNKQYGEKLPDFLHLTCLEINAGRSAQATLLGKQENTIESLYISPALKQRLSVISIKSVQSTQMNFCYA
ncbi:MAG: hypothetical protein RL637_730 [Pseudomonadota bacterium]